MNGLRLTILVVTVGFLCISSEAKLYKPKTSQELQTAFNTVLPGDTIELQPGDYYGDFIIQRSGDKIHPIKIMGSQNDDGSSASGLVGNTTTLFIKGDYIKIQDLNITGVDEGLYLEGNHNSVISFSFYGLKQCVLIEGTQNVFGSISLSDIEDGIFVRGSDNKFTDISLNNATSGIIIESGNRTKLHNMAIHDSEGKILALVLNEGTCCGKVSNTIYDGLVEVKGTNYNFRSTVANGAINILGCDNTFGRSVFSRTYFTKECNNNMVTSNIYHFPQEKPTTIETL
jgi:hypothetical protein